MAFDDIQLEDVKKTGTTEPTMPGAVDVQDTEPVSEPAPDV